MFLGFLLSLLRGEFKIFAPIPNNFARTLPNELIEFLEHPQCSQTKLRQLSIKALN